MRNRLPKLLSIAASAMLPACAFSAEPVALPLDSLSYYSSFDGTLEPSFHAGAKDVECKGAEFVDGVAGMKAVRTASGPVKIVPFENFNYAEGSVAFWVRPEWSSAPQARALAHKNLFGGVNFQICYQPKKACFFMTGKGKAPEGFVWDYGVFSRALDSWKDGEWHHVAISWNSATGSKKMYLDGMLAAFGTTQWMRSDKTSPNEPVSLGEAKGSYCQLAIWSRQLEDKDLMALAANPEASAAILSKAVSKEAPAAIKEVPLKFGISICPQQVKSVLLPGDVFTAKFKATNPGLEPFSGRLKFDLVDFYGERRDSKSLQADFKPGETKDLELSFQAPRENGPYKVSIEIGKDASGPLRKDVASFAVWPAPGKPDPESFFGNHINSWGNGAFLDQGARLGQVWVRDHNMLQATWWTVVQPEQGAFKWEASDRSVDEHLARGMKILGQLFGVPWWAAKGGPVAKYSGYPKPIVPDLALWSKYVYETVSHFKGRIKHWEVLNEPEVSMFWGGTTEEFAEVCKAACEAAKKADPECFVMIGGLTSPAWRWHEAAAKAGAFNEADAISFHYGCPLSQPEETYDELKGVMDHLQELAAKYAGRKMPLWNTEGGTPDTTWLEGLDYKGLPPQKSKSYSNWRLGPVRTVQGEALMMALGLPRHFIYFQNNVPEGAGAADGDLMLDVTGAPSTKLMARVAFASQADHARFAGDLRRPEGRFWAFLFESKDGSGSTALCWAGDGGAVELQASLPEGSSLFDLMGNERQLKSPVPVGEDPCYVRTSLPSAKLREILESSKISVVKEPEPLKEIAVAGEEKPAVPKLPNFVAPMESPTSLFTVDLRPYCNMGFADEKAGDGKGGWADEGPMNDMRDMPTGRQVFYGVPFDVVNPESNGGKSIITLKGITTGSLPEKVTIKMPPRKCRNLYFLHAAGWGSPGEIGKYVVHYADGTSDEIPISIPSNCNNWWLGYDKEELSKPVPVRVTNTATGKPAWRYLRVFEWQAKSWDAEIISIDFISKGGPQVPILVGISGV